MAEKLSTGAVGAEVAGLHELLHRHNFEVPSAEVARRFFGPGTRAAVLACQRKHRLACSGEVDEPTAALLNTNPSPPAGGIAGAGVSAAGRAMPETAQPLARAADGRAAPDMADMPDAPVVGSNPLGTILRQVLEQAGQQPPGSPGPLSDLFDGLKDPQPLPDDSILQHPPFRPPDWWSLLIFVMSWLQQEIGDPHLWLGYQPAQADWSRMLTLNYSLDPSALVPPALSVGLTVADPVQPTLGRGVRIAIQHDINPAVVLAGSTNPASGVLAGSTNPASGLSVSLSGTGSGAWRYVFGGSMNAEQAANASVSLELQWTDPAWTKTTDFYDVGVGPIRLGLELSAGSTMPLYRVTAGLGEESGAAGLNATLTPQKALGPLASLLAVSPIGVQYAPELILTPPPSPPSFTLGQRGG